MIIDLLLLRRQSALDKNESQDYEKSNDKL